MKPRPLTGLKTKTKMELLPMLNGKYYEKQVLNWLYRIEAIRLDGEFEPTVGDIIDFRKARGISYEEAIKQLTQKRKL